VSAPKVSVLIVDDSPEMLDVLGKYFADHGFHVEVARSGAAALEAYRARPADVVLTDLRMKGMDGLDLFEALRRLDPDAAVVIMTAFGNVESAVDAIQRGAFHYVTKPFKMATVRVLLERAARERHTREENHDLRTAFAERFAADGLIGDSDAFREVRRFIERVANATSPVLISGESGTGKDRVARALHRESARRDMPFLVMSCAALPEELLEAELFGQVSASGASGRAAATREGLFARADGGTLFFDEIGDMPLPLQAKLAHALQTGELRSSGAGKPPRRVTVRCVAATSRDLKTMVAEGRFREELFFRLAVVPLRLPALRERRGDLPLLLEHFVRALQAAPRASAPMTFSEDALAVLQEHPWPGNVRELGNLVERLSLTCAGRTVGADEVRRALIPPPASGDAFDWLVAARLPLEEVERRYITAVMNKAGSKARAAEILNVDVSTLYRRERGQRS
jgi:two-component system response regulator HydG